MTISVEDPGAMVSDRHPSHSCPQPIAVYHSIVNYDIPRGELKKQIQFGAACSDSQHGALAALAAIHDQSSVVLARGSPTYQYRHLPSTSAFRRCKAEMAPYEPCLIIIGIA